MRPGLRLRNGVHRTTAQRRPWRLVLALDAPSPLAPKDPRAPCLRGLSPKNLLLALARLLDELQSLLQACLFLLHQLFALADLRHLAVEYLLALLDPLAFLRRELLALTELLLRLLQAPAALLDLLRIHRAELLPELRLLLCVQPFLLLQAVTLVGRQLLLVPQLVAVLLEEPVLVAEAILVTVVQLLLLVQPVTVAIHVLLRRTVLLHRAGLCARVGGSRTGTGP